MTALLLLRKFFQKCNILSVLIIFSLIAGMACADEDLRSLSECEHLAKALKIEQATLKCKPLAEKGIAQAQYVLAELYNHASDDAHNGTRKRQVRDLTRLLRS